MENPFKFGSLVDVPYFTDRVKELEYIVQFFKSENHLILISPRRFGKSRVDDDGYLRMYQVAILSFWHVDEAEQNTIR